ncbi:PAS domain-containing sensor histidine kinase [Rufibacter latericius]|uniref:histidine kinase n=1 Tax=Rufibacter latericius TaxID=2487040 RepID=A0A3M9N071_9BACT|nr:ATP-binding protein [Rufibacter latericius]RNI31180.1 PAS domain S-box protein [Rufibacter latericius]
MNETTYGKSDRQDAPAPTADRLAQLEAENQLLRTQISQLQEEKSAYQLQREAENALTQRYEESQSRFKSIFYQSKLANKIIAPDLRVIQINEALQKMLGYSEEEIIGTRITEYAHPDFISHWRELQENLWTRQIPSFQIETCLVRKDGTPFWCQVTSILFKDQGKTLGYTIIDDITERKQLELDLKKLYDKQETIMHMVAHDLKNPLINIQLAVDLLKENLEQVLLSHQEEQAECFDLLGLISETSEKMFALIHDLLFIGELEILEAFEETNLNSFIQHQLSFLGAAAKKKGIKVVFQAPETPFFVHLHRERFKRLLDNLLSNAVKFTPAGSGEINISLKKADQGVLLQVTDTGVGIPENLQPTVFDRFTKASRLGTEGEPTTGLGLYIVKQIVELHKGQIWVESQENVGTSFFIQLT